MAGCSSSPPPLVGLGTFRAQGEEVRAAVSCALRHGLRHIDTATIYKNERDIGAAVREAIAEGVVARDDVYITSKLSPYEHGAVAAAAACDALLSRLDLGHVDLVLIHWPGVARHDPRCPGNAAVRRETWRVLERYRRAGLFRAIGVSNYEAAHLEELLGYAEEEVACNQVECHPLWPQDELRRRCRAAGVAVVAYGSLGGGALLRAGAAPEVEAVARRSGLAPAHVLLRWGLQKGCCAVIPKSVRAERIAEYGALAADVAGEASRGSCGQQRFLSVQDEALLDSMGYSLERRKKYCWDPSTVV